jgi:hypothetical protein
MKFFVLATLFALRRGAVDLPVLFYSYPLGEEGMLA